VSVRLKSYRALDGSRENVNLASDSSPLLAYRLFLASDTIDLSRVAFSVDPRSPDSNELTYRASNSFVGISLPTTLQSAEADSLDDQQHLAYAIKPQRDNATGVPFGKLDPGERRLEPGPISWVAAKNKYFIIGLLTPEGDAPFAEVSVTGGPRTGRNATRASAVAVEPIRSGTFGFELYAGPQEWRRLLALGRDFENSNPYGGFLQGVVQPFATIVMRILLWMRETTNLSYGWVLVIFGVVVRLLLWPLNQKAMRTSMQMSRLQPQLSEIQKRHKADPQRMQAEIMRVYKEHGLSPFSSLSGCFPMLLPMPILFALFSLGHFAEGPVLHRPGSNGCFDVSPVDHRHAKLATEPASESHGVRTSGDDDPLLPRSRVRPQPVLRRTEPDGTPAAVVDLERTGEGIGQSNASKNVNRRGHPLVSACQLD
jgi:YidC/Oxa1 family membrane protein insertase